MGLSYNASFFYQGENELCLIVFGEGKGMSKIEGNSGASKNPSGLCKKR